MAVEEHQPFGWRRTFAALGYRNYRLWFVGQMTSLLGTWMQGTAQGYLVYELTHSTAYLGTVAFAAGVPTWIFMLYAGVVADRVSRRAMLIVTQATMLVLSAFLAVLTFTGWVQAWHLVALAFALGIALAFDAPARQSILLELVDRRDLTNAVALNSIMFNTATALGPAAGGMIYAWIGPGWCFTINALSFLAVIAALALMRLAPRHEPPSRTSALADLREGLRYVAHDRRILAILVLVSIITIFGISYVALLPAWAVKILHGDATTNGFLQSARGVGAVLCALTIASLGRTRIKGRLLVAGTFALPLALLVFSSLRSTPLALAALVGVGASLILFYSLANTLVQTIADDALRGRVMGVYSFTFFGFLPVGALLAGTAAEALTEPWTVAAGAGVILVCAVAMQLLYPGLRRIE
jgi:MFS family permease